MRLRRLRIANVRGIHDRVVSFLHGDAATGVVIVEGRNEAGKTTLADALDVLLEHKHTTRRQAVRDLQTLGVDAGPEIEADLEAGAYRFTYRKRFLRDAMAELEIHEPRGERLAGESAHERVEEILDETMDRELWRMLRLRQSEGIRQAAIGATHGLTRALEQRSGASAVTDRELDVLDRVREEYLRYFTDKGNERRQPLGAAREAVAAAEERLTDLDGRLTELQADVERADALADELPGLREHCDHAQRRAAELSARREEVEALADAVSQAERELVSATAEADRLADRLAERERLLEALDGDRRARAEIEGALEAAEATLGAAERRQREAEHALADERERQRLARAAREQAQADLEHLRDREALRLLHGRLGRAEDARARLRDAEDAAAVEVVDDAVLDGLRSAQQEVDRARAVLEASSPVVRFTAARPVDIAVGAQERELATDEAAEWPVAGLLTLRVGDAGTAQVRAGADAGAASEAHASAVRRLEEALSSAGVPDLDEAEAANRRRRVAEQTATQARRDLEVSLEGETLEVVAVQVDTLERRTTRYAADRAPEPPVPEDVTAAQHALASAADAESQADRAVSECSGEMEEARAALEAARGSTIEGRTRVGELDRRLKTLESDLTAARETATDEALRQDAEVAADARARTEREAEKARQDLEDAGADEVRMQADNAVVVAKDAERDIAEAEQRLRDLRTAIRVRGGEGLYEQREEQASALAHARAALASLEHRAGAAQLLLETLERHRAQLRDRYAGPIREQIVRFGKMIHGPDFDVELDDALCVARRRLDGLWLETRQLSVGAQEQLALLGRVACATLLGDRGGVLIFDDALGNTDQRRLEAVGAVLRLAGEHCQVIVLTCYPERFRHVGGAVRVTLD